jgi:dihydroxycyclohexadiene carboxylate dehydrogenase
VNGEALDPRAAGARRFENKVAVVAGAGQGIGRAAARRFAQEGAKVVVGDFVEETATRVADEIKAVGGDATIYVGDFSQYEHAEGLMKHAQDTFGRIDALANIVGGAIWWRSYRYFEPEQIKAEVNKSLWPSMWLCRAVLPCMIEQRFGAIVNVATHAVASKYRVPYGASKGGVIALTTSLSKEVAEYGIRVNCIAPHSTRAGADDRVTPRNHGVGITPSRLPAEEQAAVKEFQESLTAREIPLNRSAVPAEQASAIVFLASEDASFITGQVLPVGGGATYPF